MFNICVETILIELNRYIKIRIPSTEDAVIYLNYIDLKTQQKESESLYENKIIMSLVDIAQEDISCNPKTYIQQGDKYILKNLPTNFYINLLFATNFKGNNALTGLKYLTLVIAFFQSNNHFTNKNTPSLQATNLEEFSVSLVKLEGQQKNDLWKCLDITYQPSILYKAGLIPIVDVDIWTDTPVIQEIPNDSI